jgi:hypothetical protein
MGRYIWRRRMDGIYIINLGKTWEKLMLGTSLPVFTCDDAFSAATYTGHDAPTNAHDATPTCLVCSMSSSMDAVTTPAQHRRD